MAFSILPIIPESINENLLEIIGQLLKGTRGTEK
jgi:hypothetical protein